MNMHKIPLLPPEVGTATQLPAVGQQQWPSSSVSCADKFCDTQQAYPRLIVPCHDARLSLRFQGHPEDLPLHPWLVDRPAPPARSTSAAPTGDVYFNLVPDLHY